jgi:pyruvate dehydrogenase E1 component alpha subunit
MSDPVSGTYRSVEEVEKAKHEQDPIATLRDQLMALGVLDAEALDAMDKEARKIAADAADFADASPVPSPDALYRHVWADVNPHGRLFFDGRERP